jgi:hypothetical protein
MKIADGTAFQQQGMPLLVDLGLGVKEKRKEEK